LKGFGPKLQSIRDCIGSGMNEGRLFLMDNLGLSLRTRRHL
jgi:hypothetical protein